LHDGEHFTEKRGHVDWNRELVWKMRQETEMAWDLAEEEVPEVFTAIRKKVADDLKVLKSTLCGKYDLFFAGLHFIRYTFSCAIVLALPAALLPVSIRR
jgi:hypothetical protein